MAWGETRPLTHPPLFGIYFGIRSRRWGEKGAEDGVCTQD